MKINFVRVEGRAIIRVGKMRQRGKENKIYFINNKGRRGGGMV